MIRQSMFGGKPSNNSFSAWAEQQRAQEEGRSLISDESKDGDDGPAWYSVAGISKQLNTLQDNVSNQLQELSGQIPEAGPLSAAFRARVTNAMYLLIASVAFLLLAIFVGLPTIVFRPSKFVVLLSLSTLCAASTVIVMQTPSGFLSNLVAGGFYNSIPVISLLVSVLFTLYVTIFVHRFFLTIIVGAIQVLCVLYYLAAFIPGGRRGMELLFKAAYMLVKSTMGPCLFVARQTCMATTSCVVSTVRSRLASS
jgi:hypothetical protein